MELPLDKIPERSGMTRDERRARRQGAEREKSHLEDTDTVVAAVGFNPYPDMEGKEYVS